MLNNEHREKMTSCGGTQNVININFSGRQLWNILCDKH